METKRPPKAALRSWIKEVASALPDAGYAIPGGRNRDFGLLYGPCIQASRFASSYLTLETAGFAYEGAAVIRAAFEHAVTAHWAYFTTGGIDRFAVAIDRSFTDHNMAMAKFLDNEELQDAVSSRPARPGKGLPTFTDRMRDLDSSKYLETTYRSLSLALHPTHAAVTGYLVTGPDHVELKPEPDPSRDNYPELHTAALSAMLAKSLLEHIINPERARTSLETVSTRLQLPPFIHDGLAESMRRFDPA